MTYEELKETVKQMQTMLETPLSLYCIGNVWTDRPLNDPKRDDRSWAIRFKEFVDTERPKHHYARHNFHIGQTANIAELTVVGLTVAMVYKHQWLILEADRGSEIAQLDLSEAMDAA